MSFSNDIFPSNESNSNDNNRLDANNSPSIEITVDNHIKHSDSLDLGNDQRFTQARDSLAVNHSHIDQSHQLKNKLSEQSNNVKIK